MPTHSRSLSPTQPIAEPYAANSGMARAERGQSHRPQAGPTVKPDLTVQCVVPPAGRVLDYLRTSDSEAGTCAFNI